MSRHTMEATNGPLNKAMNDAVHEEFVELHVISKNVQSYGLTEGWKICCWKWPYINFTCFVDHMEKNETVHGNVVN